MWHLKRCSDPASVPSPSLADPPASAIKWRACGRSTRWSGKRRASTSGSATASSTASIGRRPTFARTTGSAWSQSGKQLPLRSRLRGGLRSALSRDRPRDRLRRGSAAAAAGAGERIAELMRRARPACHDELDPCPRLVWRLRQAGDGARASSPPFRHGPRPRAGGGRLCRRLAERCARCSISSPCSVGVRECPALRRPNGCRAELREQGAFGAGFAELVPTPAAP